MILYTAWFLIDMPWIILNKPYLAEPLFKGALSLVKDLLFASTFPGSWFLSALVVSVGVVYLFTRVIKEEIVFVFSLLISLYVVYNGFSNELRGAYDWYSQCVRKEVYLSFPIALVWVSIGQLLAKHKNLLDFGSPIILGTASAVIYTCSLLFPSYLWNYLMAIALVWFALTIILPAKTYYKTFRETSTIIYLFHFSIAGKMSLFINLVGYETIALRVIYYILVVLVSFLFAFALLRIEKYFPPLKYLH